MAQGGRRPRMPPLHCGGEVFHQLYPQASRQGANYCGRVCGCEEDVPEAGVVKLGGRAGDIRWNPARPDPQPPPPSNRCALGTSRALPPDHANKRQRLATVEQFAGAPHALTDDLGECIAADVSLLNSVGWEGLVKTRRGKHPISPNVRHLRHPASRLLDHFRKSGVPVKLKTAPWSLQRIAAAAARGAHPSAKLHQEFLTSEYIDMWRKGQMAFLPLSVAVTLPGLRLSPPASIPQRNRRNRNLLDLSFWGVNNETAPLWFAEAMQFGTALPRLLHVIFNADPRWGPVWLFKNDLSDGFFRIPMNSDGIPQLGAIMPHVPGQPEPVVAFHLSLPMGWTGSPPGFSTFTETVADVTNARMRAGWHPPKHRLEAEADTLAEGRPPVAMVEQQRVPLPMSRRFRPRPGPPVSSQEIYVDDFVGAVQGSRARRRRLRRILLHVVDEVFEPTANDREPSSVKKMRQGDCSIDVIKEVLGWIVDCLNGTIALPARRQVRLAEILSEYPRHRRRVAVPKWQSLLGEIRSMALALPGLIGCFSMLQKALDPNATRVKLTTAVHDQLDDIRWLASDVSSRPTRIAEIIPGPADYAGTTDASGDGFGSIWLPLPGTSPSHPPLLSRAALPADIRRRLVTFKNPSGDINMGEIELAGRILADTVLSTTVDLTEANVVAGSDSMNTRSWHSRGSASSFGARAYLLRFAAFLRRYLRYQSHTVYIPGPLNRMADDASRLWHLTDSQLLAYFNSTYPQSELWQLCQPNPELLSVLISSLRCRRVAPEEISAVLGRATSSGTCGAPSATNSTSATSCSMSTTPSPSSSLSCSAIGTAVLPSREIQYVLEQWKMSRVKLAKRSNNWGPPTFG